MHRFAVRMIPESVSGCTRNMQGISGFEAGSFSDDGETVTDDN